MKSKRKISENPGIFMQTHFKKMADASLRGPKNPKNAY